MCSTKRKTRKAGPQRSEGVSGSFANSGSVQTPHVCYQMLPDLHKSGDFMVDTIVEGSLEEQSRQKKNEQLEESERGGQTRGGEDWRLGGISEAIKVVKAQVQQGDPPEHGRSGRDGRVDASRR